MIPGHIQTAVESPNRMEADRRRDEARKPAEVMAFFGIKPGDRVAEIMAGTGYHAGLLCEVVGKTGKVFAHNTPGSVARRNGNPLRARISKCDIPQMEIPVSPCDALELEPDLDAVLLCHTYHDTVWTKVNREAMNAAIFNALKPGGIYGIIDHNAQPGAGLDHAHTYHRVEKQAVIDDIVKAGFVFDGESNVLENSDDPLNIDVHEEPVAGRTSRFVVKFRKPI